MDPIAKELFAARCIDLDGIDGDVTMATFLGYLRNNIRPMVHLVMSCIYRDAMGDVLLPEFSSHGVYTLRKQVKKLCDHMVCVIVNFLCRGNVLIAKVKVFMLRLRWLLKGRVMDDSTEPFPKEAVTTVYQVQRCVHAVGFSGDQDEVESHKIDVILYFIEEYARRSNFGAAFDYIEADPRGRFHAHALLKKHPYAGPRVRQDGSIEEEGYIGQEGNETVSVISIATDDEDEEMEVTEVERALSGKVLRIVSYVKSS